MVPFIEIIAAVCLVWVLTVVVVQAIGVAAIFRFFSEPAPPPISPTFGHDAPTVTIIRPVKGLEPRLYECIASTFQQNYPKEKLSIRLCVEDETDPAYPVLQQLIHDFPGFDAKILTETSDPVLHGTKGHVDNLGPNPKIRNISRAYRDAQTEIIWIIDCNVWVAKGVLGRMVDKLMGFAPAGQTAKPYRFVHQMPLVVDTVDFHRPDIEDGTQALLTLSTPQSEGAEEATPWMMAEETSGNGDDNVLTKIVHQGGGRLDEIFFATTHVKFYGAINAIGIAPCIVGKSNMFRKAHLDQATTPSCNPMLAKNDSRATGVDFFSYNICEDHLIGELLWKTKMPGYLDHGIVWGDVVLQPMAGMSVASYAARRCRWLRARKFTVLAATLVEPGIESLVCCAYLAFALTTLPWFHHTAGIPSTWTCMGLIWLAAVTLWMAVDWRTFQHLHSGRSLAIDAESPRFARGTCHGEGMPRRGFAEWFLAWLAREVMALPVWTWAVLCGTTVRWRGKTFRVDMDASVVEIHNDAADDDGGSAARKRLRTPPEGERERRSSKDRVD